MRFNIQLCNTHNVSIPDFVGCSPLETSFSYQPGQTVTSQKPPESAVSTITQIDKAFTTTADGPVASYSGNILLSGTCAAPHIATYTLPNGGLLAYPWVGCSDQNPNCCPFPLSAQGPLTVCPYDYYTTASACCPSGWSVYTSDIAGQTPCFTDPPMDLVASTISTPSGARSPTAIKSKLFTLRYTLSPPSPGLSDGVKAGIGVGAAAGAALIIGIVLWWRRHRRLRAQAVRDATIPRNIPEIHDISSPASPSSKYQQAMSSPIAASASPRTPHLSELPSPTRQGYWDQRVNTPTSGSSQQDAMFHAPRQVSEMMGDTNIHEHHPAFKPQNMGSPSSAMGNTIDYFPPLERTQSQTVLPPEMAHSPSVGSSRLRSGSGG